MTGVLKFSDGTQFTMKPEETERYVAAYGAKLRYGNEFQTVYKTIEPSSAQLIVNTHSEAQYEAIQQGNREYRRANGNP